ncbi:MAG: 4-alpha-glucanotransferase, partial [Mucilaginibacter sp.]
IEKTQWLQFIFNRQWLSLKKHCNQLDIQLFGDLPFYVGYDSVDVWSHPELFSLRENLDMERVAGVPPDYFNSNGQLWGMPVFRWDKLKDQHYQWWVQRIKKNRELFDLLRLDHFRAFSSYWAVPSTEDTAINGTWEKGPGRELFDTLRNELGDLPFVAEDLGDIDDAVYQLRDGLGFPGMKVLQFAFGNNLAASPHIPHNYTPNHVAYTGTHDNNTLQGWFQKEAGSAELANLNKYTGLTMNRKNLNKTLISMAESSVAKITIVPLQDLLNLDESARMNTPAATAGNWAWRLTATGLKKLPAKQLQKWVKKYNRL